ncbi:sortase [Candidatus Microgenomates bacterium]|nr:sortase [Candidatus Microgenomates bacterium]
MWFKKIGLILFFAGLFFLSWSAFLFWERNNPARLSFAINKTYKVPTFSAQGQKPIRLKIDSQKIDLPVFPASLELEKWSDTKEGVSFLNSSALPGEKGNSVFYGHNWANLLGNLNKVKRGDKIEVFLEGGKKYTYYIYSTSVVTPDQTHIILPTNDTRLTIYTCTGLFDSRRFVAVAVPSL